MSNELAKTDTAVANNYRMATDVAGVCREIVTKTAQQIQGRKYVRVEGWQAIATAHGCVASARDVEKVPGGWRAIGEVRRMDTGMVIAVAEGFVGEDEPVWAGGTVMAYGKEKTYPKRPEYACRAMAQTRAISRVCRSAFAHVVVLIDAELSTTPAEEVPYDGFDEKPAAPPPKREVTTTAKIENGPADHKAGTGARKAKSLYKCPPELDGTDLTGVVADLMAGDAEMPVVIALKGGRQTKAAHILSDAEEAQFFEVLRFRWESKDKPQADPKKEEQRKRFYDKNVTEMKAELAAVLEARFQREKLENGADSYATSLPEQEPSGA